MMAYFSNGSEGSVLDTLCYEHCPFGEFDDEPFCPVAQAQFCYNYEQLEPGQEKLRDCLSLLIEQNEAGGILCGVYEMLVRIGAARPVEELKQELKSKS